ncbi:unnamed protein product [marine sediment metagenome]|uniref:HTH cro/C1-type domain-containing protein n=2 Tax=marine sediment metagenome TaxID=412755 RepID=X0Z5L4_9ZZZZ
MTKLSEILKKRGIKQIWIAEKLGVSETAVSHWVKGKHIPQPKYILKLSKLLEVSIEELINEKIFSNKKRR